MNLALRPDHGAFTLEKWYIDALEPDGTVTLVYLARMRILGVVVARVTVERFSPGGQVERADAAAPVVEGGEGRLRFGPAEIDGDRLHVDLGRVVLDLCYHPRFAPVRLRDPFLQVGARRLDWHVEIPDADVDGTVQIDGDTRHVRARGYRDRVWFDLLPWRFPIRTLLWGRGVAGEHATTWVNATLRDGALVAASWTDGALDEPATIPPLGPSRVLIASAIVDLEGLRLGWARPVLRLLTGDPREEKRAGEVTAGGVTGLGVHEVVRWS